jgi:hypothetical protein
VLNKYNVDYFICENCGFVQTEEPYWLNEAYSEAINRTDVGLVSRNMMFAKISKVLIPAFFNKSGKFVDYGGGYGLFVRMMRDSGLDFYWFDKACPNLFAKGFVADTAGEIHYELVTAFEVFEHLANPLSEVEHMLEFSKNILFSTELLPDNDRKPVDWWYYGFGHGQHISFYTTKSLELIAKRYKMYFCSNGALHLFSKDKINRYLFYLLSNHMFSSIVSLIVPRKSLLQEDSMLISEGG